MSYIENISRDDCRHGWHIAPNHKTVLIQISDPAAGFPDPKYFFQEVHQFEFLDAEGGEGYPEDALFSDEQAVRIADILSNALQNNSDVIVHCHAGICRSGAIAEVGTIIGFTDTDRNRIPNIRVKTKLMKVFGLTYDSDSDVSEQIQKIRQIINF